LKKEKRPQNTPAIDKARVLELLAENAGANKRDLARILGLKGSDRIQLKRILKELEAERLLEEVQYDEGFKGFTDRLICELFYATGMRRNELLQLKESDIEWSLNQVRILGKGNKERLVPVSPVLLDTIRDYLAEKRQ